MITALEGNRVVGKVEITRETPKDGVMSFPEGSIYTISHVMFRDDCSSGIAFSVDQMPGLLFDSCLPFFMDDFNFTEDMIKNWVDETDHPEGL
jgi:hypothetical protein